MVGNPTVVSNFSPFTNVAILSEIFCTGIAGNPTVVSNFFLTSLGIVLTFFALGLLEIQPLLQTFFLLQTYP